MPLYPLMRPLVFALDAERAHRLTIAALKALPPGHPPSPDPLLSIRVAGLDFPNPVGLAAGFDKDGEVPRRMAGFGFGFVEVGTLTPRPQPGNARPRLFRLAEDRAVINRMGFNNKGQAAAAARLARQKRPGVPLGINVGANKDRASGAAAIEDYRAGIGRMGPLADYLTVNISSPNTPGLRGLQDKGALGALLAACADARAALADPRPVFLKVAPDLDRAAVDDVAAAVIGARLDGIIIGNTTVSRPPLRSRHRGEAGGLSGAPLKALALERLRDFAAATGGSVPLIAAGGIENGVDAYDRIRAGASLVQLYSALVYEGPGLARRIAGELRRLLTLEGFASLAEAVGSRRA